MIIHSFKIKFLSPTSNKNLHTKIACNFLNLEKAKYQTDLPNCQVLPTVWIKLLPEDYFMYSSYRVIGMNAVLAIDFSGRKLRGTNKQTYCLSENSVILILLLSIAATPTCISKCYSLSF